MSNDEKKPLKVVAAPGVDVPPEMMAHLQALADLGGDADGLKALLEAEGSIRQVCVIPSPSVGCAVCHGVLIYDKDWGEYECNATSACKGYAYIVEDSPGGQNRT